MRLVPLIPPILSLAITPALIVRPTVLNVIFGLRITAGVIARLRIVTG